MTAEEAIKLLHPATTAEALAEIECYGGFNGKQAKVEAVNTACLVACEALEKQILFDIRDDVNKFTMVKLERLKERIDERDS